MNKPDLETARRIACMMHFGQLDKVGEPYILHVQRVAESEYLIDDIDRIIAWFHDIVEDTAMSLVQIERSFGAEIAHCVDNVTKRVGESTEEYFNRVNSHPRSSRVKYSDSMDNKNRDRTGLDESTCNRLDAKYTDYLNRNTFGGGSL